MRKLKIGSISLLFLLTSLYSIQLFARDKPHWLLGYDSALFDTNVVSTKANIRFDSTSYLLTPANFKMPFLSAQSTFSDEYGNLKMSTNGCWIADATGDTMFNGGGLLRIISVLIGVMQLQVFQCNIQQYLSRIQLTPI